ncbi:MAG TPA: hypothetical protein VKE70_15830 [Candidatus Solibacter sp.]|nr:hypothetical protein [Candidatus Solibacter sp.]
MKQTGRGRQPQSIPPTELRPRELVWTIWKRTARVDCHLCAGVTRRWEVQLSANGSFFARRAYGTRTEALKWAASERQAFEQDGWSLVKPGQ